MTNTVPDSEVDWDHPRVKPDIKLQPMVPRIIHEPDGEEDMATNLKTGFKERQRKHLSESIAVATPSAKKPCMEAP